MLNLSPLDFFKSVDDLNNRENRFQSPIQQERRKKVKIAVIDDQFFEAGRNLRNHGYQIEEIGDIKQISEVSSFPIILCDLMGVGLNFDKTNQGASLIREIRKNYPSILVAAYTGASATSEQARRAKQYADRLIKKDADIETWVDELDKLISKATDAREIWMRTRKSLVEEQINTKLLLRLEDAYVRSLEKRDPGLDAVKRVVRRKTVGASVSNIIDGLVASSIFRIIVGG